jgi:acyl carrier protein
MKKGWDSLPTLKFIVALGKAFDREMDPLVSVRAAIEHFEALERKSRS